MGLSFEVQAFRVDARVSVKRGSRKVDWTRGQVSREISDRSKRRLIFSAVNASAEWSGFAAATYPNEFPQDGRIVKAHVNHLLVGVRQHFEDCKYLWALEFQDRGAAHIHLLVDKFIPKEWLSEYWYRVVGSGDPKHLRAGTRIESAAGRERCIGYLAKTYLSKQSQKVVPDNFINAGRWWGMSRGLVRPLVDEQIEDFQTGMYVLRCMRRFTERRIKPKRVQPVVEGAQRSRPVKRRQKIKKVHSGLYGLSSFGGASVLTRLVSGAPADCGQAPSGQAHRESGD